MKKRWGLFIGALVLLLGCVTTADAEIGIGPYVDLGAGGGELEWNGPGYSWDVGVGTAAVGFALDTAPIGPAAFSYRLNVGFEGQVLEDVDNEDNALDLSGVTVENVFAFSVVRRPTLRWWVGPLVRFGFYSGETDEYVAPDPGVGPVTFSRYRTEAELFEFGIGAATGVNIPVGKARAMILAPTVGFRVVGVGGEGEIHNLDTGTVIEDDLSGSYSTVFVNFALLF
jgi:hypothetical protein